MESVTQHEVQYGENDRCWKDLESSTGFSSYAKYLKNYHADHTFIATLLEALNAKFHVCPLQPSVWTCSILDFSKTADSAAKLRQNNSGPSGGEILEVLHQPLKNVCVRIPLWHKSFKTMLAGS